MGDRHHVTARRERRDDERRAVRHLDGQRMVATDPERARQAGKQAATVVDDRRCPAVHRLPGRHDARPEGGADALVAEADAEDRQLAGERPHRLDGDARLAGTAGTGADDDRLRFERFQAGDVDGVVAQHPDLLAEFDKVASDVADEAVVVVEHDDHAGLRKASTSRRAFSSASSNSAAGSDNSVMPPPAPSDALPLVKVAVRMAMLKSAEPSKPR